MIKKNAWMRFAIALVPALLGCGRSGDPDKPDEETYVVEHTDYSAPPPVDFGLTDDRLEDKKTEFNPAIVDRRPLGDWLVNQSAAVIRLDVPLAKPDSDEELLVLRPSYADSLKAAKDHRSWVPVLPSVNLLDGKAKQFDDGLYAAVDLACFQGIEGKLPSNLALVERLLAKVDPKSPAAAYLAAGLTLGGHETPAGDTALRDQFMQQFNANPAISKPLGFYTWSKSLEQCWAFMKYFQQPLDEEVPNDARIIADVVKALQSDAALSGDCQHAAQFFGTLTNPLVRLTFSDIVEANATVTALDALRNQKGMTQKGVALFPPSTSRESELFDRLFGEGLPENANLMKELVTRIRSGEIDLSPRPISGWYDYQVYALETMLLPERGDEHNKLLLTKPYKKKMLEAFQALITKRRETHVRQLHEEGVKSEAPMRPPETLKPRLRIEPCPSYYLRTARSYAFLNDFLTKSIGSDTLKAIHGLRKAGPQSPDLAAELASQRDLFYGLYLVSCEDIGLAPALNEAEAGQLETYYNAGLAWLEKMLTDPDLAEDTRVAVPVLSDLVRGKRRIWVTLGVRLTQLDAKFVKPPHIKPAKGDGDWREATDIALGEEHYLISVDEFAEVELLSLSAPNRDELRKMCNRYKTKDKIVEALAAGKW